jgi:phosphohistidine phosphatase
VEIFLIRHAQAVDETLDVKDPARPLTALGRDQARSLGERLRWHDCEPTHVLTSPLVRAVQTAELVTAALGSHCAVNVEPALAPGASARQVVSSLAALPAESSVILFGHEPVLSDVAALLVGDPDVPALSKAEAVRISGGRVRWRFAWDADAPTPAR